MIPFFQYPLFFLATLFVVPVIFVYIFRRRSKISTVSSLILWYENKKTLTSGKSFDKLPIPLSLILEIIIILLLSAAAALPMLKNNEQSPNVAFIIDNSFSMQAGKNREKALEKIRGIAADYSHSKFFFFLSGENTRTLGESFYDIQKFNALLKCWNCEDTQSNLFNTIGFAKKVLPHNSIIIVISDSLPAKESIPNNVKWIAIGTPMPNAAFVNTKNILFENRERCLFEIANFSDSNLNETLSIRLIPLDEKNINIPLDSSKNIRKIVKNIFIPPNSTKKLTIEFKHEEQIIEASLKNDNLNFDNKVLLLSSKNKYLNVALDIDNKILNKVLKKALPKDCVRFVKHENAQFLFSDKLSTHEDRKLSSFIFHIIKKDNASFFKSPFIIEHGSPFMEAVYPDGVVWSASHNEFMPGMPLIQTSSAILLSLDSSSQDANSIHLQIVPGFTSLFRSPAWPVLIWNVVANAKLSLPGPNASSFHQGAVVKVNLPENRDKVEVVSPDLKKSFMSAQKNSIQIKAGQCGVWRVRVDADSWSFTVNALNFTESNLSNLNAGEFDNLQVLNSISKYYINIAWAFIIAALVLLIFHYFLTVPRRNL